MDDYTIIKDDFEEISQLEEPNWNHNNCYFDYLVKLMPKTVDTSLDIGCGKGELSEKLSRKSKHVIAVDLSDKMIERAKKLHSKENVQYLCGNILDMKFENESLNVIITTATAHHLPYEWLLCFAKEKLKQGGRLIVLDLVKAESVVDYLIWGSAIIPNIIMNILKNHSLHKDDEHSKEVWRRHGKHDVFMTLKEIRVLVDRHIPSAKVKRKYFWRYVLIWTK